MRPIVILICILFVGCASGMSLKPAPINPGTWVDFHDCYGVIHKGQVADVDTTGKRPVYIVIYQNDIGQTVSERVHRHDITRRYVGTLHLK